VGQFWSSDIPGYMEMKLLMGSQGRELFTSLLELAFGVARQITRRKMKPCIDNQHVAM